MVLFLASNNSVKADDESFSLVKFDFKAGKFANAYITGTDSNNAFTLIQ